MTELQQYNRGYCIEVRNRELKPGEIRARRRFQAVCRVRANRPVVRTKLFSSFGTAEFCSIQYMGDKGRGFSSGAPLGGGYCARTFANRASRRISGHAPIAAISPYLAALRRHSPALGDFRKFSFFPPLKSQTLLLLS